MKSYTSLLLSALQLNLNFHCLGWLWVSVLTHIPLIASIYGASRASYRLTMPSTTCMVSFSQHDLTNKRMILQCTNASMCINKSPFLHIMRLLNLYCASSVSNKRITNLNNIMFHSWRSRLFHWHHMHYIKLKHFL